MWENARNPSPRPAPARPEPPRPVTHPPRVDQVTRRDLLGVHEAIPLPVGSFDPGAGLAADLPLYVPRDADPELRAALARAKDRGGFVVLVGGPAVGKTRSAHEALLAVVPDWKLVIPADGAAVDALAGGDPARSVLWLDELLDFLTGPAPLKPDTVRRLLHPTRPMIIIGTMWREDHQRLRAGSPAHDADAHGLLASGRVSQREARQVLAMAELISLGDFRPAEWARAAARAGSDPRIAQALRHGTEFSLPQVLAGTPELLHRWNTAAQPYGKALLTAAVTARRAGHPSPVPARLLQALAPLFLSGRQRAGADAAWFDDALAWAREPVFPDTGIALLSPYAHPQTMGSVDGYRVSDVLAGHLDINWSTIPAEAWQELATSADPAARVDIGFNAALAGLSDVARTAWRDSEARRDLAGMYQLGVLTLREGDPATAHRLLNPVADAGYPPAMHSLAGALERQGDIDGARHWLQHAAEAGEVFAMIDLAELLYELGEGEKGLDWARRAAERGGQPAMTSYARLLHADGQAGAARKWLVRAATEGQWSPARRMLAVQLYQGGDMDSAQHWLELAAGEDSRPPSNVERALAMHTLGEMYRQQGDPDNARAWWTRAADLPPDRGNVNPAGVTALYALGLLAFEQQDVPTARGWLSRAAEAGSSDALYSLGQLTEMDGDPRTAAGLWQQAARAGHLDAMVLLGLQALRQGDAEAGTRWFTEAAEKGSVAAQGALGILLSERDPDAARPWLTRAAERGVPQAVHGLIDLLQRTGTTADAEEAQMWRSRLPSKARTGQDTGSQGRSEPPAS